MTTVHDILVRLESFAPYSLAEDWDNVGLLVGNRTQEVKKVLCALDITEKVVEEAAQIGAQLIVAHHPLIFTSINAVTDETATGRTIRQAIRHNISLICMHTNADCADGGVNDALASALGLTNIVSLEAGQAKMLGRVGDLSNTMEPSAFAVHVKQALYAGGVRFVNGGKPISRVAVGGGACGKLMDFALAKGAQAFVIGDCSYDIMQRAESLGLTLVDAGHFPTENPIVTVFATLIQANFPSIEAIISQVHRDCIQFV